MQTRRHVIKSVTERFCPQVGKNIVLEVSIGRNGERAAQQREQMRAQREAARAEREAELARKTIDLASARAARTEQ